MTLITFVGGWWGIISFFVTPVCLVQNLANYLGARDTESGPPSNQGTATTTGAWKSKGAMQRQGASGAALGIGCGATALILGAVLFMGWLLGTVSRKGSESPRESGFNDANQQLFSYNGEEAFGNTPEAKALATSFSTSMALLARIGFTGGRESQAGTLTQGHFLTHCELREKQICFLVHVPELKNYAPDAKKELLKLAWITAKGVSGEARGGQEVRIAVGLRGALMYGAAAVGTSSGEPTMDLDIFDTHRFAPFFSGRAWVASATPSPTVVPTPSSAAAFPKEGTPPLPTPHPLAFPTSSQRSEASPIVRDAPVSRPATTSPLPIKPLGERANDFVRLALAGDEGPAMRLLREFRSLGPDARPAAPAIAKVGRDFHVPVALQIEALATLGDIGGPEAASLLADAIGDRYEHVQTGASRGLGRLRGDDVRGVIPKLADNLELRCPVAVLPLDTGFCYSGLNAIAAIGPDAESATASLVRLVKTKVWRRPMKHHAIRAIGGIGPRARNAVPALTELLQGDPGESWEAAHSLGRIGSAAASAIPDLRRLLATLDKPPKELARGLAARKAMITAAISEIQGGRPPS